MAEEPSDSDKWKCDYCTFKNWSAAKKCTMCLGLRRQKFITDPSSSSQAPDIYQVACESDKQSIASSNTDHIETSSTIISGQKTENQKWTCPQCTYLNWAKTKRCVVCKALSPSDSTDNTSMGESSQELSNIMEPLVISVQDPEPAQAGYISNKSSPNSQAHNQSKTSPSISPNGNNDKNSALASAYRTVSNKWSCRTCTYENWPKASNCLMCGSLKGTREKLNCRVVAKGARSPPTSPRGAAANVLTNNRSNKSSSSLRDHLSELDCIFLKACIGIVDGDRQAVHSYVGRGGDPYRILTCDEVTLLGSNPPYYKGQSLIHLAVQMQREDILAVLVTASVTSSKTTKRLPPHVCPDLASELLRIAECSLRQRKGDFPCLFLTEQATFVLPSEICELLPPAENQLLNDILDHAVQRELEVEEGIINWNSSLNEDFGSRLYALWNRSAGDCLLDSVLQATWGVFDNDNTLRRALYDSLSEGSQTIKPRWKEFETHQALLYQFTISDDQWERDWSYLLSLANQPGSSLEQTHIFTLAHILRRPIIVYGVKYIKTFSGEQIDLAKFQGIYLPLFWESNFCWKSPIALGYTRGHFSALVAMDPSSDTGGAGAPPTEQDVKSVYLPLVDKDGSILPVHFATRNQSRRPMTLLREWLTCRNVGGVYCAEQPIRGQPPLVAQMVDEWFERYKSLSSAMSAAGVDTKRRSNCSATVTDYETDEE